MISEETYYKRAFAAARARGHYEGMGMYRGKDGRWWQIRTYEEWQKAPELGYLEEVNT